MQNILQSKTNISNKPEMGVLNVGKKVFVGMSGGVDSSVSAFLLNEQGYDVTGVFIKSWHPDFMPCNWKEERRDAMRVCAHLEIPFLTCDLEEVYKKEVIDYMIEEYKKGNTPNPDIMCNKEIKFGAFMKWATGPTSEGGRSADFIATGHYAQNIKNELITSKDLGKDQTYFLWTLTSEQLSKVLFPVGHLDKTELRKIAEKANIPTFAKKDSQGICFLGKVDIKEFLQHYVPVNKGNVLNSNGEIIGEHDGALFYTFGERHGFTIHHTNTDDAPLYVIKKDLLNNTITVSESPKNKTEIEQEIKLIEVVLRNYNAETPLFMRYRYRQTLFEGSLSKIENNEKSTSCILTSKHVTEVIASGQSIVFYQETDSGLACIGGGIVN